MLVNAGPLEAVNVWSTRMVKELLHTRIITGRVMRFPRAVTVSV